MDYKQYINSIDWYLKKEDFIKERGRKCEWCGETKEIEVHHTHYDSLGDEKPEDVLVLCHKCHEEADFQRKMDKADERYEKAMDTYLTKKYGEDWAFRWDVEALEDEFEKWFEDKERDF